MNRKRLALMTVVALGTTAAAILLVTKDVSQYDSTTEGLLRNLHRTLLVVAVALGVAVEAALFYTAIRFHGNNDPKPTEENQRLEVTWTVAVALVLLFVGSASYVVLADPMVSTPPDATPDANDVQVRITGQNWFWSTTYPEQNVAVKNELVLPVNRTIFFEVTSKDVIHSVHIPGLGIKQDAIPGRVNTYRTRLTGTGTYRLYCAEYCGTGHSKMMATVRVVPQDEYQAWLQQRRQEPKAKNASALSSR
ncbi:cytochrome c oxidase subunit II [Haloarcula nitratireducens]|uniref:cytochrome-c oxidase n=1 Tax=Haloarcula nitratireducens TaxID=2487749 RepID=A0AAW4PFR4_9EURY|nr:cytochrome c oxidase subunit II [Halomicroarcula nitratireducens]MBX0296749.1 cytochrome c oxidase subunit II [Halomicroarcula nitratireducens]